MVAIAKKNYKNLFVAVLSALLSLALALLIGALVIQASGQSALATYKVLWQGAFVGKNNLSESLIKASMFLLTGLSYAFVAKCGLINIGAEGQLYMGAACSTAVGIYWTFLPPPLHMLVALFAGFVGGALWGGIVGILKAKFNANEIITSLMLNYIATLFVSYLVSHPMKDQTQTFPYSHRIADSARLPLILRGTRLHIGVFIALFCLFFYWFFYRFTAHGYRMRVIGGNCECAEYAGYDVKKYTFVAMMIGGGFAGIGGALEILGIQFRLFENFSTGYGFDGIAASLLAGNHPFGMLLTSILFGGLRNGGNMIQMFTNVSSNLVGVVQSLVIILVIMRVFRNLPLKRTAGKDV